MCQILEERYKEIERDVEARKDAEYATKLAEKETQLAEKDAIIADLMRQIANSGK